jgi:hypothetical protein
MKKVRFLGLDVHAETIAVAVAEPHGEVRSLGIIPNREESVRRLIKKLGPPEQLRACYEAGPTINEPCQGNPMLLATGDWEAGRTRSLRRSLSCTA